MYLVFTTNWGHRRIRPKKSFCFFEQGLSNFRCKNQLLNNFLRNLGNLLENLKQLVESPGAHPRCPFKRVPNLGSGHQDDHPRYDILKCRRFLRARKCFCSRKRHVETSRREEEIGRVKGSRDEAGREKRVFFFFPPPPRFPSFTLAPTLRVTISTLPNLPLS